MLKLTKFLAGVVAAGSVAYADDLPKVKTKTIAPEVLELPKLPDTPAKLPEVKKPAPIVPLVEPIQTPNTTPMTPSEPTAIPPSTMTTVENAVGSNGASRIWGSLDYGIWRVKAGPVANPLIVLSLQGGAPNPAVDEVLFGGGPNVTFPNAAGLTATLGYSLTPDGVLGVEASLLVLEHQKDAQVFSGTNNQRRLRVPYTLPDGTLDSVTIHSFPGGVIGSIGYQMTSELWGYDARMVFTPDSENAFQYTLGYRHLNLHEGLELDASQTQTGGLSIANDAFYTTNRFHGAQVGIRKGARTGRLGFDVGGYLAMGVNRQTIDISGARESNSGLPQTFRAPTGMLTHPTNVGVFHQSRFSVVPEVNAKLSYQVTSAISISVGYQAMYWTNVVRPGNLPDNVMNVQPPGLTLFFARALPPVQAGNPAPQVVQSDFWAQGLLMGITFKY